MFLYPCSCLRAVFSAITTLILWPLNSWSEQKNLWCISWKFCDIILKNPKKNLSNTLIKSTSSMCSSGIFIGQNRITFVVSFLIRIYLYVPWPLIFVASLLLDSSHLIYNKKGKVRIPFYKTNITSHTSF